MMKAAKLGAKALAADAPPSLSLLNTLLRTCAASASKEVIKAHGTGMTTDMNMEDMEDMEDTHGGHSWRTLMEDHMLS